MVTTGVAPQSKSFSVAIFAKYFVVFALGVVLTLAVQHLRPSKPVPASVVVSAPVVPATNEWAPLKRWGRVELKQIPLEDSEEVFLDRSERLKKPRWIFENFTQQQTMEFFQSCGLSEAQKQQLLDPNRWEIQTNQTVCHPTDDLVLGLEPDTREKIYSYLGRSGTNYNQYYPFRFPIGGFETRLTNGGFAGEKLKLIRSLIYTNDGLISFCDLAPLQTKLATNEFDALIKALYSIPAERLRLRVTSDSDVNALLAYWGKGIRTRRLRPLLESLVRTPGSTTISVSYFMPAFARMRLFTYPDPANDAAEGNLDCFYTSLNFFNDRPDTRFLDPNINRKTLQNDYKRVSGPPNFGDLITLINDGGDAVHICVYIAEDVVFTKNGANYLQPWVLMKIPNMLSYFPSEHPLRLVQFRRKDLL